MSWLKHVWQPGRGDKFRHAPEAGGKKKKKKSVGHISKRHEADAEQQGVAKIEAGVS